MPDKSKCEECGAELPANAPQGLCPRCLLGMGLSLVPTAVLPHSDFQIERAGTMIGRYKLLEKIGEGGFGVVYMAEQVEPVQRNVALKIIKAGMDTREVIARFEAERQAIALMDHPNIARALDAGATQAGRPYFVMELVRGIAITEYCDQANLPTRERLQLFMKVCQAVQHAHQKGVIHRDIKPSNVLVTEHDGEPVPKVIDFGVAKALGQRLTEKTLFTGFNHMIGTPAYMSPEQAALSGLDIDTRADIYSLGVLLYELLTGATPFDADTLRKAALDEIRRMIRETEPLKPSTRLQTLGDELPEVAKHRHTEPAALSRLVRGDLDWIVMKCLEKDRQRRYETAHGLAMDVARHLNNQSVVARSPSNLYRFQKLVRRHKLAFAAASAVAASLVIGLGAATWSFFREKQAHRRAVAAEQAQARLRLEAEADRKEAQGSLYATDMNLALRALGEGNPVQALQLVLRHAPRAGEVDRRGFEWRHLWWCCRGDYETALPRHNQVVGAIAFSADSKRLATYCWDDTLRLWDIDSRAELLTVTNAAGLGGFTADGAQFVIGRRDGTISIFRPGAGESPLSLTNAGQLVAVAANGRWAVTVDPENRLKVWELASQQMVLEVPGPVRPQMDYSWGSGVALAPDGKLMAVLKQSNSPGRSDEGIRLWNVATGNKTALLAERRQIRCLVFAPDGKTLAVGDGEGWVWLWDLVTLEKSKSFAAHQAPVLSLAFSSDGQTLASGSSDQTIKLWDLANVEQRLRTFRGHAGAVWSLAFSPDGQRLASGSRDTTVKIWSLKGEETREVALDLLSDKWGNFTFSPDSKLMAAGCINRQVRVWDVKTLEVKAVLNGASYAVAFSADASALLTASMDEAPQWWNVLTQTATPIPGYHEKIKDAVSCVDLSPDRRIAALGFVNGNIQVLEINSGQQIARFLAHPGGVSSIAFSPLGDKFVSGGRDKSVALWDARTRRQLGYSPEHRGSLCAVAASSDGNLLASGCSANTIKFWNPMDMRKSLKSISYHESVIRSLCFSPDARTLASGSEDDTVKLWNVVTYQEVASFKSPGGHVRLVLFSPDANNLAVVTDHGSLQIIRATPKEQADRELTALLK